jgi:hypothetical protein
MKFGTSAAKTETSGGIGVPQQFSIQNSAIAFETLSSRLYTDPIRAVIRELSCNAQDANVEAGKSNTPFIVTLPTNMDPSFKIRDFGMGMTNEQVLSLYCTYFSSSKNDNNKLIGAFGLGSKSPFAYFLRNGKAGGFAVVSYQKGTARTYAAFIDSGFPKVELQSEMETTEPDGLEVIFPVEQLDVWEFENKAKIVFEFCEPMPTLNKQLNIEKPEYTIKTKRWGLRKNGTTAQGDGIRAIMGIVAYAVGNIDVSRMSEAQKHIFEMPLDIFFEIGEVNPAVSREQLQLDGPTIDAILKALDEVNAGILEEVKQKIEAAADMWEAKMVVWDLLNHGAIAHIVNEAFNTGALAGNYSNFTFDGNKGLVVNELDYDNIKVTHFRHQYSRRGSGKASREQVLGMTADNRNRAANEITTGTAERKDFNVEIEVTPKVVVILDDMKVGRGNKFINYFIQKAQDNEKQDGYVISPVKDADQNVAAVEVAKLLANLGNPPTVLASSLATKYAWAFPKRVSAPRTKGLVTFEEKSYYRGNYGSWWHAWQRADEDAAVEPGTKYYITVMGPSRKGITGIEGVDIPDTMSNLVKGMRNSGLFGLTPGMPIYALRPTSPLRKHHDWVEFKTLVNVVPTIMTPTKEAALSLQMKPFRTDWGFILDYVSKHLPMDAMSKFQNFAILLNAAQKDANEENKGLSNVLSILKYKVSNITDFNQLWESVKSHYPLLGICRKSNYNDGDEEAKALVAYLRMNDAEAVKAQEPAKREADKREAYRLRKVEAQKHYVEKKKQEAAKAKQNDMVEVATATGAAA